MTMTRRAWLASSAFSLASLGRTHANETQLPLGFSLYGMKSLPVDKALAACEEIGYRGVELACMPGWPCAPESLTPADRRTLRKQLEDHGLALHGLMENLPDPNDAAGHRKNLDRLQAAAELGHDLIGDTTPVIETILGRRPTEWEQVRERFAERMRDWAEVGKTQRAIIAIKPHVSNALHTPEAALWLLDQVQSPWLKLAYDYSHYQLRNLAMEETVNALAKHSSFVHVKDARGSASKVEFLLPGEGTTDYIALGKALVAARYTGPVVVEVSGQISNKPGYDPLVAAKFCYAKLAGVFRGK